MCKPCCCVVAGLDVVVVKGAKRGHNIIQNSEQGWQLSWRRPVVQGFEGLVPMVSMRDVISLKCWKCRRAGRVGWVQG